MWALLDEPAPAATSPVEVSMPALAVTLAQLQGYRPLPYEFGSIITEAIDHLGEDSPPQTSMPIGDLLRAAGHDYHERAAALNLLHQTHTHLMLGWYLECADMALGEAKRVVHLWDGEGVRSSKGPVNVILYAGRMLQALRRREPIQAEREWFSWSRHHAWYLGLYCTTRSTSTPFLAVASAVADTFMAHGGSIQITSPPLWDPETGEEWVEHSALHWRPINIMEAAGTAAGEARYAEIVGRRLVSVLRRRGELAAIEAERDRVTSEQTERLWTKLIAHFDADSSRAARGLRVIDGGGQPAQPRPGSRPDRPRLV